MSWSGGHGSVEDDGNEGDHLRSRRCKGDTPDPVAVGAGNQEVSLSVGFGGVEDAYPPVAVGAGKCRISLAVGAVVDEEVNLPVAVGSGKPQEEDGEGEGCNIHPVAVGAGINLFAEHTLAVGAGKHPREEGE